MPAQGFPVVISDNEDGFPVNPVLSNYPLMTVTTNGRGTPITIDEMGAPFVLQGYEAPIQGLALSSDDGSNLIDDDDQFVETF